MPLQEELETQGRWLFRKRSLLPLLATPFFVFAFFNYSYPRGDHRLDLLWEMFCLVIALAGLAVRVVTTGCTPKRTSGRNTTKGQVADSLNTSGMYSLVRHPLYLGNFLMALGPVMFLHVWWLALFYVLFFWLYYERIMLAEEQFIRDKFGQEYEDWASQVPAFLPRLHGWTTRTFPFSWRTALKREYHSVLAVVALFATLEVVSDAIIEKQLVIDEVWAILLGLSIVFYLSIRLICKTTRWLHVEGR